MLFSEIRSAIRGNLDDAAITFYSEDNLTESMQDAYDDIAFQTQCIIKKDSTIEFPVNASVFNVAERIEDYLTTLAIFNPNTNRWLFDHVTLRQFDQFRIDWELWSQTPQFWAPVSFDLIAIVPHYAAAPTSKMDLYYAAKAPLIVETDSPLIAKDYQSLIELYSTGDRLEQAEEYTKAGIFWEQYIAGIDDYRDRVHKLAKRDLLMKI